MTNGSYIIKRSGMSDNRQIHNHSMSNKLDMFCYQCTLVSKSMCTAVHVHVHVYMYMYTVSTQPWELAKMRIILPNMDAISPPVN